MILRWNVPWIWYIGKKFSFLKCLSLPKNNTPIWNLDFIIYIHKLYHIYSLSATYVLSICYTPGKAHCIKALYNPQRARKLLAHYLTPRRKLALTESCVSLWRNIGQGWDRRLDAFVYCLCQTLYRITDAPLALWCQTLLGFTRLNYRFSEINI